MKKIANPPDAPLDPFDRCILDIVQRNANLTHAQIGQSVGLSASAVRRRLNALRESKVIEKEVAILKQQSNGVRLIITVSFQNESIEAFQAFDQQIMDTPEIVQGYHVSGTEDYVLIVHGPNLEWYEEWGKKTFMNNTAIRRYDTRVIWSCKKFETAIPL
jgi:Lrp/AsnC family transcriptional regulator, leucine-responsive regulatory protein